MFAPAHPVLVRDRVRCVGDPVAFLVAETVAQAEDAAELVRIDYEPLPAVTATAEAARPGSPPVWDECPDNVSNVFEAGDRAAADAAFARAEHVVRRPLRHHPGPRPVHGAAGRARRLRPRRGPLHALRRRPVSPPRAPRAGHEHLPDPRAPGPRHRGGHRRRLRDQGLAVSRAPAGAVGRAEAGAAGQVGVRAARGDPGRRARPGHRQRGRAGPGRAGPIPGAPRPHRGERRRLRVVGPEPPGDLHERRHAGRRLHDPRRPRPRHLRPGQREPDRAVSRGGQAGVDLRHRAAHRRRRPRARPGPGRAPAAQPHPGLGDALPHGVPGDLRQRPVREEHGQGPRPRRRRRVRRAGARHQPAGGRLRGLAVVNAIERAASPQPEFAEIRFDPSGGATVLMGTKSQGQGHETTFKQVLHERLGLDPDTVRYVDGDTDRVAFGTGTMGSRSTVVGGLGAVARGRQGDRQGQADRRAPAGGGRDRPPLRGRPIPGDRDGPGRDHHRRSPAPPSSRPSCHRGSSRVSTRPGRSFRGKTRGRTAATSARWRSTPTRAPSRSSATWWSTTWAPSSIR